MKDRFSYNTGFVDILAHKAIENMSDRSPGYEVRGIQIARLVAELKPQEYGCYIMLFAKLLAESRESEKHDAI